MQSSAEAFDTWFEAFSSNYFINRNSLWKTFSWQAWQAALNYAEQCREAELNKPGKEENDQAR